MRGRDFSIQQRNEKQDYHGERHRRMRQREKYASGLQAGKHGQIEQHQEPFADAFPQQAERVHQVIKIIEELRDSFHVAG